MATYAPDPFPFCNNDIDNTDGSLDNLSDLRKSHRDNPFISYLNINSLRGDKFNLLGGILSHIPLDILCVDETKLTIDFPDSLFNIEGYQFPHIGETAVLD